MIRTPVVRWTREGEEWHRQFCEAANVREHELTSDNLSTFDLVCCDEVFRGQLKILHAHNLAPRSGLRL